VFMSLVDNHPRLTTDFDIPLLCPSHKCYRSNIIPNDYGKLKKYFDVSVGVRLRTLLIDRLNSSLFGLYN